MPIDFQPEAKIDFIPEKTAKRAPIDFRAEPPKPKGLTYRPFANLRSLLRKPTTTEKKEQIGKVMERSKWEIGGLQQWTKGYWDAVSKGKIKEFQKLERRLSEEKRNPIDALEKVGMAGLVASLGIAGGQMLEPAFVSAVAKIRPDLIKPTAPRINLIAKKPEVTTQISPSVQRVMIALKRVKPLRRVQETIYTKEKGVKLAKGLAAEEKVIGEAGYEKGFYAKLGAMKGEMTKVQFESIRKDVSEQDIENLFRVVKESRSITEWDKIPAAKGLGKLFGEYGGRVPTDGEISLLNRVFPQEFTKALLDARPMLLKFREAGLQLANIPRAIMASFDLSFGLRQGAFLAARHPILFSKAFMKQFSLFGSEKAFKALMESIAKDPLFGLAQKGKLSLTELGSLMSKREESAMSPWAEKIPGIGLGVRASARAYTGMANKFRFDIFKSMVKHAERLGRNPSKEMKLLTDITSLINCGTGRGSLGGLERAAVSLNAFFFSPRLMASRLTLLNPVYYVKLDPFVRKEALKSLFSFVGAGLTMIGIAKMAGAKVGGDPRSADFGKIKIGNTRIDFWAGFMQYIVPATRLVTGQAVSSTTGKVMTLGEGYRPLTRYEIVQRAIEYKQAPIFSFVTELLKGQTFAGKPISLPREVGKRFIPMAIQDIYDIMVEDPNLLPVSLLGIFGVGLQTYKGRGTAFSFKGIPKGAGKLKLGGKSSGKGKLSLGK